MEIKTGGTLEAFDSMRRSGRQAARALAALGIFTLTMVGCGGGGGLPPRGGGRRGRRDDTRHHRAHGRLD
jgi:hypothetical protein